MNDVAQNFLEKHCNSGFQIKKQVHAYITSRLNPIECLGGQNNVGFNYSKLKADIK